MPRPDKIVRMFLMTGDKQGLPKDASPELATAIVAAMDAHVKDWRPADVEPGLGLGLTDEQLAECHRLGVRFSFRTLDAPDVLVPKCPDCNGTLGNVPTTISCSNCGRAEAGRSVADALQKFKDPTE